MEEKENVLKILQETKIAFEKEDSFQLKHLSNQTIHTISITHDSDNIAIAVIIYSLSKIVERKDYKNYLGWTNFHRKLILFINNLIISVKKNNNQDIKIILKKVIDSLENISGNLKENIKDVFRKARINKASRIYEHGISMEKTAKLLGISIWELANYIGQTGIADNKLCKTCSVKSRIKLAMNLFK